MRDLSPALQSFLARTNVANLVTLIEILGGSGPIRMALGHAADVVYEGETFWAQDAVHTEIYQDTEGRRNGLNITVRNQGQLTTGAPGAFWSTQFMTINLNGAECRFIVVPLALIDTPGNALIEENWIVSGYDCNAERFQMRVGSPFDMFVMNVPRRPIVSTTCGLKYKQGACTSESTLESCPYTVAGCRERFPEGEPMKIAPGYPFYQKNTRRRG